MRIVRFRKLALLSVAMVALASCTKQDLYNPNHLQDQAKENFPVKDIDPTHTWAMMSVRTSTVKVGGVNGASYTLKFYSENPIFNAAAPLMAKATATGGSNATLAFDSPLAMERVFISREGADGRYVAVANLEGDTFVGSFEGGVAARSLSRAASLPSGSPFPLSGSKVFVPTASELTTLFPTAAPSDAVVAPATLDNSTKGTKFLLTDGVYKVNFWDTSKGKVELYIAPNASVSFSEFSSAPEVIFHLLPGAKLTKNDGFYSHKAWTLTIGAGATLTMTGESKFEGVTPLKVYNQGTIKGSDLKINQYAELYNYGVLDFSESIRSASGGAIAVLYNAPQGVLNTKSLYIGGAAGYYLNDGVLNNVAVEINKGAFENNGKVTLAKLQLDDQGCFNNSNTGIVTVSGETKSTQSTCYWINSGMYTTNSISINAGNDKFYNYCKLFVKGNLSFSDNTFHLMENGYIECDELTLHNTRVELGSNAVLNVLNKTTVRYNDGINHGLYGIGTESALVNMGGETVKEIYTNNRHMLKFAGNLIYAAEKMFEETNNSGVYPNILVVDGSISVDYPEVKLPTPAADECAPDWSIGTGGGSEDGDDKVSVFTYGFEDMTKEVGDYDFNDLVLQVTAPIDGKIKVTLLAAGAVKNLRVGFNNIQSSNNGLIFEGKEAHELLGVAAGTITNTVTMNGTPVEEEIVVGSDFRITKHGDFYLVDESNATIHIPEFTSGFNPGDAPYAVRVPKDWAYPLERVSIEVAYPDFTEWTKDVTKSTAWYNNPVADKVFTRTK
ncbi:MAG: DUF4842 domain-containing protein [Phocaeicola sp.]